jgi:hypothetical protein
MDPEIEQHSSTGPRVEERPPSGPGGKGAHLDELESADRPGQLQHAANDWREELVLSVDDPAAGLDDRVGLGEGRREWLLDEDRGATCDRVESIGGMAIGRGAHDHCIRRSGKFVERHDAGLKLGGPFGRGGLGARSDGDDRRLRRDRGETVHHRDRSRAGEGDGGGRVGFTTGHVGDRTAPGTTVER